MIQAEEFFLISAVGGYFISRKTEELALNYTSVYCRFLLNILIYNLLDTVAEEIGW